MNKVIKCFYGAFIVSLLLILVAILFVDGSKLTILYTVIILALMEISLSFDNAIINARILQTMSVKWRKLFLILGIPIAVFIMRLIFPVLLVNLSTDISFIQVAYLAMSGSEKYHQALEQGLPLICSFGGAFLMMVFLKFFLSDNNEHFWFKKIENNVLVNKIKSYDGGYIVFAILIGYVTMLSIHTLELQVQVALAFFLGILVHELIGLLNHLLKDVDVGSTSVVKNCLVGFLYLEVMDASFSLDGVVGAFAISTNIVIIAVGLGVGAIFIRSLTIFFVEKGVLAKYKYLEHGAHYAIGFLAFVLIFKIFFHVPEWLVGGVSIFLISSSLLCSIYSSKKE